MRSDRGTKTLLAVIALGIWALTMTQMETPGAMAAAGEPGPMVERVAVSEQRAQTDAGATRASAGPLRWRIGFAGAVDTNVATSNQCFTSVSLLSTSADSIESEVVFFGWNDLSVGSATATIPPGGSISIIAQENGVAIPPFDANEWVVTGKFDAGFAHVYADDPRVLTTAFLVCVRDRLNSDSPEQQLRTIASIPSFPVGATMEYFQAGMPANWTPQIAVLDVPE